MSVSVFRIFKVGLGPSSSHTTGPMVAAHRFLAELEEQNINLADLEAVTVELYGSLALTGIGHGTDKAVLLGLSGLHPESLEMAEVDRVLAAHAQTQTLQLGGKHPLAFSTAKNIVFLRRKSLPGHANGMVFIATQNGEVVHRALYYSIGGGFVLSEQEHSQQAMALTPSPEVVPYPFRTGAELLDLCTQHNLSIAQIMRANEAVWRSEEQIQLDLLELWGVMERCIERGCQQEGLLPGKLKVKRRAADLYRELQKRPEAALKDPLAVLDWVNLYALAVNEENASGSQIVTAPTNGAAGVMPAVIKYYLNFCAHSKRRLVSDFFLTAGAIGLLFKENASISGAEVGCQGEVGVACAMAAAGLTAVQGGTPAQVEEAAEIGMEHNLGLTCDPIGGLVQIPCIERNAMGAVKAINAARIALRGKGEHFVSLDSVIKTMKQTGADMKTKYKETSRGGLAVNVPEC